MSENIISWNVTNWITVVLMVAIGWVVVNAFRKMIENKMAATAEA